MRIPFVLATAILGSSALAQPGLTIYNGRFAVVRDTVALELKAGENNVRYSGATSSLDPSTVILRDPSGKVSLTILEQNYQNDPVNELTLLERFEGQSISFLVKDALKGDRLVEGKVVRSGYIPGGDHLEPIIEADGKIMFELPGRPLFPNLKDDGLLLKPRLNWKIQSPEAATLQAELAYLTQGLEWEASYNLVLPEGRNTADLNGWVTIRNGSGKQFDSARIKLMAGDVRRSPQAPQRERGVKMMAAMAMDAEPVSEKAFDDFHLYTLPRPTTLRDQETKQLEFTHAGGVPTKRIYTYEAQPGGGFLGQTIIEKTWNTVSSQKKVSTALEFMNSEASSLGIPLPAGMVRVYRKDGDQLEFVGEDRIGHMPKNEKITLRLGNAFDLVGERKRTIFQIDASRRLMDESFEIKLRNQSKNEVEIRVVEHLTRAANWNISAKSIDFKSLNSHTIQFDAKVPSEGETVVTYTVHYTW